ncbi:MAG: hypothetical protein AAGN35_12600 [Bacteroidota bacterium]
MPDYFRVDERTMADYLAFASGFSSQVEFYDEEAQKNDEQRTWDRFFNQDITVILAAVVSVDIDTIDSNFEYHVQNVRGSFEESGREAAFEQLYAFLVKEAAKLPSWYAAVVRLNGLPGTIENVVEMELWKVYDQKLREALQLLNACHVQAQEEKLLLEHQVLPFPDQLVGPPDNEIEFFRGKHRMGKIANALIELRSIYHIVFNVLAYAKSRLRRQFDDSLLEKQDHPPDMALFIVFLKLYQYAQADLNTLTLRHLEYYYRHILKQDYRPAISDAVHVCAELVRTARSCRLPAGTLLFAGRDDEGREIHYSTTEEVEINQASIASLKSVFISRVLEGQTWTYKLVTNFYGAPVANSLDGKGMPFMDQAKDWPLFGEEQYKAGRTTMQPAEIGFAISSPMFMLAEGRRRVKLHITFREKGDAEGTYRKLIEDLTQDRSEEGLKYALLEVFGRGRNCTFNILVSGAEGWINVAEEASNELYVVSEPWSWNRITIAFTIPASCPPVVPINPSVMNPEGFSTKFPVVKLELNPLKNPFGYTFLETLAFEQVDIDVEVDRVKSLILFNDLGRLDATQPFQAFGPTPRVGSYMLVGNSEVFRKKLDDLHFYIEYQNLPQRGIAHYYKEYFDENSELSEEKYKINLTALSGYEFKPGEKDDPITHPLFPSEVGKTVTHVAVPDPGRLQIRPNPDMSPVNYFDNQTPIGFFRFELTEPREAFGHTLYQERLSYVAQRNAEGELEETLAFPNPPYSPLIKTIYLSYKASDKIVIDQYEPSSRNEIYHLHPFGSAPVFTRGQLKVKHGNLIPEYRDDGYLYIGLKNLFPPQELSLLFQLAAGKTTFTAQLPETEWSFLAGDDWEPLRSIDVLSDTTERFTKTGIIRLRIPAQITDQNGVLDRGLFWLRVSLRGDTENVSRALEIRAQALEAEWVDNGDPNHLRTPLAAGSINNLVRKRPEVRGVVQPYPSYYARAAETRDEFFQRVSERLRHKGRAVSHWDYERLILDRFHTISQVKCLSHISDPDFVLPGELRVVVIPGSNQATDELTPKVNHGTLLAIQNFLKEIASPFVNIRVSNPSYEYVRINCRVKFSNNRNNGDSLAKLRKDIQDYICPWLGGAEREIEIGGNLRVEDLYRFIRSLAYVDFVTKFAVLHFFIDDETTGIYELVSSADTRIHEDERAYVRARKPWSVLIPDSDHEIEFTEREAEVTPEFTLQPVDFQGRFQISPHLIKILNRPEAAQDNPDIRYDQEDTLRIFVDLPD